jgi:hypothetical protein
MLREGGISVDHDKRARNLLPIDRRELALEVVLEVLDDGDHPLAAWLVVDVLVLVGEPGAGIDAADARQESRPGFGVAPVLPDCL